MVTTSACRRPVFGGSALAASLTLLASGGLVSGCTRARETPATAGAIGEAIERFDSTRFVRSTHINNPWLPLRPGMRFVYEGTTVEDDGTTVPHRVEIHVTDLQKRIGGVGALVTWDLDYSDGQLVEAELAFLAQDTSGTVWRMGEYPEEYEDGKFTAARPWIHGFENARAGIMMWGDPRPGTPSYAQGWGPAVGWTDRGQVEAVGQQSCVPTKCYDDVLVIEESSSQEQDAQQIKYYARDVGNIRVSWRGAGEKTKETLELTRIEGLDAAALAAVRAKALALERDAYRRSPAVYAQTAPAEPIAGATAND